MHVKRSSDAILVHPFSLAGILAPIAFPQLLLRLSVLCLHWGCCMWLYVCLCVYLERYMSVFAHICLYLRLYVIAAGRLIKYNSYMWMCGLLPIRPQPVVHTCAFMVLVSSYLALRVTESCLLSINVKLSVAPIAARLSQCLHIVAWIRSYLRFNSITSISSTTFSGLTTLTYLYVMTPTDSTCVVNRLDSAQVIIHRYAR